MKIQTKKWKEITADTVVVFMDEKKSKSDFFDYLNDMTKNELYRQIFSYQIFKGGFLETYKYAINENLKVLVVGLGKLDKLTRKKYSQVMANSARIAKKMSKSGTIAFELIENSSNPEKYENFDKADCAKLGLSAFRIGLYEFSKFLSEKNPKIDNLEIAIENNTSELDNALNIGAYTSLAMNRTKDLVNEPAQNATPEYIAQVAKTIAKENKLECKIYSKDEIKKLNMNAFLAVGQGSTKEPKLIHLTYKPNTTPRKKIALVGKGITFDAGGMNIKPAASMLTMKSDMTGAATVISIIEAISKIKPDIELHIISALCENMTSGSAYKQGDVLKAMNGKTIEIDNTDAEGRLTLADALTYADTIGADEVIDIATLTGAVIVSLGNNITGVLGNNQEQIDKFIEISKLSAENTWQMPILEELKDNLKSEIADFKNTGGRNAGTSTAGWFLSNFTKSAKWLHLDIAGTAYLDKSNKETLQGPTGVMIRSLINYLLS